MVVRLVYAVTISEWYKFKRDVLALAYLRDGNTWGDNYLQAGKFIINVESSFSPQFLKYLDVLRDKYEGGRAVPIEFADIINISLTVAAPVVGAFASAFVGGASWLAGKLARGSIS